MGYLYPSYKDDAQSSRRLMRMDHVTFYSTFFSEAMQKYSLPIEVLILNVI